MYKNFELVFESVQNLTFEEDGTQTFNAVFYKVDPSVEHDDPIHRGDRCVVHGLSASADVVLSREVIEAIVIKREGYSKTL